MRGGAPEHIMEAALCRIEVLRIFRQKIRLLCSSNQPCLRVCVERPVDLILQLTGIPSLWHPDQLHIAEWQAMQQLEFIFNVTLSVDAKNMALAKLAKHKGLSLINAEMSLEPARDPTTKSFEMEDVGVLGDEDDVAEERVETTGLLPPSFSETEITAFLWRVEEVQLAKQPGQGRREACKTCAKWILLLANPCDSCSSSPSLSLVLATMLLSIPCKLLLRIRRHSLLVFGSRSLPFQLRFQRSSRHAIM
jgi:hypothetical protein